MATALEEGEVETINCLLMQTRIIRCRRQFAMVMTALEFDF